jgi:hypothetical protein
VSRGSEAVTTITVRDLSDKPCKNIVSNTLMVRFLARRRKDKRF